MTIISIQGFASFCGWVLTIQHRGAADILSLKLDQQ